MPARLECRVVDTDFAEENLAKFTQLEVINSWVA
jgi:hypothetical protein